MWGAQLYGVIGQVGDLYFLAIKKFQLLTLFMPTTRYIFPTGHIRVVYIRGLHSIYLLYKLRFFLFFIKKKTKQTNNKKVVGTRVTFKLYEPFVLILHFPN